MADNNFLPGPSLNPYLHDTGHVLTKIQNLFPLRRHNQLFCRYAVCNSHRFALLGSKVFHGIGKRNRRKNYALLKGTVDGLSHVNFAVPYGTCFHRPVRIRSDNLFRAVLIDNMELRQRRNLTAVVGRRAGKPENPLIPAVSHGNFQKILLFSGKQLRHVIGLILQTFPVICPARRKKRIACFLPVYMDFINAQSRRIDTGALYPFAERKGFCKYGTGRLLLPERMGNPLPLKVFSGKQAGFKATRRLGHFIVIIPHNHPVFINRFRQQWHASIFHKYGLLRLLIAGIPRHCPL